MEKSEKIPKNVIKAGKKVERTTAEFIKAAIRKGKITTKEDEVIRRDKKLQSTLEELEAALDGLQSLLEPKKKRTPKSSGRKR